MYKKVLLTGSFVILVSLSVFTYASSARVSDMQNNAMLRGRAMNLTKLTVSQQGRSTNVVKEVFVTFDDFTQRLIVNYSIPAENVSVKLVNVNTGQIVYSNSRSVNQTDQEAIDLNGLEEGLYELTFSYPDFIIVGNFTL